MITITFIRILAWVEVITFNRLRTTTNDKNQPKPTTKRWRKLRKVSTIPSMMKSNSRIPLCGRKTKNKKGHLI